MEIRKILMEHVEERIVQKCKAYIDKLVGQEFEAYDPSYPVADSFKIFYSIDEINCIFIPAENGVGFRKGFRTEAKVTILPHTTLINLNDDDDSDELWVTCTLPEFYAKGYKPEADGYLFQSVRMDVKRRLHKITQYFNLEMFKCAVTIDVKKD